MATITQPGLDGRLQEARLDAQELNRQLHQAEAGLQTALDEKRYAEAEDLKKAANALREPLLIAEAHVQALEAGVQALREHQQAEERAQREREAREQAAAAHGAALVDEQAAVEEMQSCTAEWEPAYQALRQAIAGARAAEERIYRARVSKHAAGIASGRLPEGYPTPSRAGIVAGRIEASQILSLIWRTERLL
ncbi:hypothetical protein ACFXOD_11660 [Streptomyces sp. NPDC059161]|uniref:hypothetical protein n=1 Tax=Streptomyces sp. NPDC059161 TaxID=3346749 RepID=UPI00369FE7E4